MAVPLRTANRSSSHHEQQRIGRNRGESGAQEGLFARRGCLIVAALLEVRYLSAYITYLGTEWQVI